MDRFHHIDLSISYNNFSGCTQKKSKAEIAGVEPAPSENSRAEDATSGIYSINDADAPNCP